MTHVELYRERILAHHGPVAAPVNSTTSTVSTSTVTILGFVPERRGKWRWRFVSNGHVMADSGQGYSRRIDCLTGCAKVLGANLKRQRPGPGHPYDEWMERPGHVHGICFYTPVAIRDLTREAKP